MLDRRFLIALALLVIAARNQLLFADESERKPGFLYVATYSPKAGDGIFVAKYDRESGRVGTLRPTGGAGTPAALALHPGGQFLYATTLIKDAQEKPVGGVAAFAIDSATGELREIERRPSGGTGPCYLSIESQGRCLVVANCGTASVACLKLEFDGRFGNASTVIPHVGESRNSEGKPQAHSIVVAPGNRFAIAADLGLDRLFVYRLDAGLARLTAHDPPFAEVTPRSGPRHLAFHPQGQFAYAVNELGNTVTACTFQGETGRLHPFQQISTLPNDFRGESYAAEIQVHPSGRFLYASNRGHDSLAMFSIDQQTGRLTAIGSAASEGKFPRHFAIDPAGEFLLVANQKSDGLIVFRVDTDSGRLKSLGSLIAVPQPVCVRILTRP